MATESLETRILPATIVVTSLADTSIDDGDVTLREAILAAETDASVSGSVAGNGADTITFADGLSGTITLAEANTNPYDTNALLIGTEVTIIGPGQDELFIDGDKRSLLMSVSSSAIVSIKGMTFQNGRLSFGSAGISSSGKVSLSDTRFRWNRSTFSSGGAIENAGEMTIDSSVFHNNYSEHSGSAIYNNSVGILNVDRSSFFANDSTLHTGAIDSDGTLVIANSTFSQNRKGGIVVAGGSASIVGSTIVGNRKTGLQIFDVAVTMHNTVVTQNFKEVGGVFVRSDIESYGVAPFDSSSTNNFITYADTALGISDGTNGNHVGTAAAPLDARLDNLKLTTGQWTQIPLPGSPLIEAGNSAQAVDSNGQVAAHDQTGLLPRIFDTIDIGAVELNSQISIDYLDSHHEVTVIGTDGDDAIVFAPGATYRVAVNQSVFTFDSLVDPIFHIDGQDGTDQIRFELSRLNETVFLSPLEAELYGPGYETFASDFEFITVDGNGGHDTGYLYDSDGDDVLVHKTDQTYFSGDGFFNVINNFSTVYASASDGEDSAQVYLDGIDADYSATAGNLRSGKFGAAKRLTVGDRGLFDAIDTWLTNTPDGRYTTLHARDRVELREGSATILFGDADGQPILRHTVHNSYDNRAFSYGTATAVFYDTDGDDVFTASADLVEMKPQVGDGYYNSAASFASYVAYSTLGNDIAQIEDTAADDLLISESDSTIFTDSVYVVETNGFATREFRSVNGGHDTAYLYDSEGVNHFAAEGTTASINNSDRESTTPATWSTSTVGYTTIVAAGIRGGFNTMDWIGSLGFEMIRLGRWSIN